MNLGNLETRLAFLKQRMGEIRAEGEIAPPGTWIQKYVVPKKNGKKYYYYRLLEGTKKKSLTGSIQGKVKLYLGSASSALYKRYVCAIERRNELKGLQNRYEKLLALYRAALAGIVSQGNKKAKDLQGSRQQEVGFISLSQAIEQIKQTQEQLGQWLRVIADKLGLTLGKSVMEGS